MSERRTRRLSGSPRRAGMALNDEVLKIGGPDALTFFNAELRAAVAAATDAKFIEILTTGISPTATNGAVSTSILQDIATLLSAVTTSSRSRLFLLVESSTAKAWAAKVTPQGELAFPTMTPNGGTIAGISAKPARCRTRSPATASPMKVLLKLLLWFAAAANVVS